MDWEVVVSTIMQLRLGGYSCICSYGLLDPNQGLTVSVQKLEQCLWWGV